MIKLFILTVLLTVTGIGTAFAASGPEGLWLTENKRSVIEIGPCSGKEGGDDLCGRIFWIIKGGMQTDYKNPDEPLRSKPMCGLPILLHFHQQDATHWTDGEIYKADDGDTYHATMQMLPTGKLLVRGYIGMPLFGQSQTWERVSEKDYPHCKAAKAK